MPPSVLRNNSADHRYELFENDEVVAIAQYRVAENAVTITHTKVDAENEGKGHGSELARQVLDDIKARGMRVVPACQFIASFIGKNAQYRDLVAPERVDKTGVNE